MDIEWGRLHSTENYKVAQEGSRVRGWVVLIDGKWIARNDTGTIRADFDTMEEAQNFLTLLLKAQGENT
jgi:hypothetical protein